MQPTRRACVVILAVVILGLPAGAFGTSATAWAQTISSVTPLALRPGQTQDVVLAGNGLWRRPAVLVQLPAKVGPRH